MTPRKAIAEKCKDCIYDELDIGTCNFQIENCESIDCSLYEHRPLTNATQTRLKEERYQNTSPEERIKADKKAEEARKRFVK